MLDAVDIPTCGPLTNRYTQVCTRKSELKTHKFGQSKIRFKTDSWLRS